MTAAGRARGPARVLDESRGLGDMAALGLTLAGVVPVARG